MNKVYGERKDVEEKSEPINGSRIFFFFHEEDCRENEKGEWSIPS